MEEGSASRASPEVPRRKPGEGKPRFWPRTHIDKKELGCAAGLRGLLTSFMSRSTEMWSTFNMGIGFCLVIAPDARNSASPLPAHQVITGRSCPATG